MRTFMSVTIGARLGSHEITGLLGKGGFDWFLTHAFRTIIDRQPGEIVTTAG